MKRNETPRNIDSTALNYALADRRTYGLDDHGFSHGSFLSIVQLLGWFPPSFITPRARPALTGSRRR